MKNSTPPVENDAPFPVKRQGARAALYSIAAAAFSYPDESTVHELTHPDVEEGLKSAADTFDLDSEVERLQTAFAEVDIDELESAYNNLFGIPGDEGTYPVVPYEVEYTIDDDIGRQQRRIATVVGLLKAFGLEPGDEFDERQDHIVVELELMAVLAARRAIALSEGDDETASNLERAEAVVLDEHLSDFVPPFARAVREATDEEFFCAAADLTEALVTRDGIDHPNPDVERTPEVKSHV